MAKTRPLITLEEHFVSEAARTWDSGNLLGSIRFPPKVATKFSNISDERLKDMDAGSVTLQVISHRPTDGSAAITICRSANDELKSAVESSKGRFAGFTMIPMSDPAAAAEALQRCVETLGFVGTLVNNHDKGHFYDDDFFRPVFAKCQSLDVPIYDLPAPDPTGLDTFCWGWHSETGAHVPRLFARGLFDAYPGLKVIIGHMGEMLPFMLDRVIRFAGKQWPERKRDLQTVWDQNGYVTTAGMFSLAPMACLLRVCEIEHILYSVDYPFESNEEGREFMRTLSQSGLCTDEQMDKIGVKTPE